MRFRLCPSAAQEVLMLVQCAHARYAWNLGLEQRLMFPRSRSSWNPGHSWPGGCQLHSCPIGGQLTVAGVATGITAYLSEDRRRAGWVSAVLLTIASWIRLVDYDLTAVEWYTLPAATALLVYGIRRLRQSPGESSWRCLAPGLALAMTSSLVLALADPVSWRGLSVGLASVALVALGVRFRLAAPFAFGAVATALLALRYIWPVAAAIPRWTLLFIVGGALLVAGMTWESRVNDARTASRYVRGPGAPQAVPACSSGVARRTTMRVQAPR